MSVQRHPCPEVTPEGRALNVVGQKWTLLIIVALEDGPLRFTGLQRCDTLRGISTEQLRTRLTQMVVDGLVTRQRYREAPPRVDYELTAKGRALQPTLRALAAWAHTHTEVAA